MNKFLYTLLVLFFVSVFNVNAKAASSLDVVACPTNANGEIVITSILAAADQTCDGEGASNLAINVYSLGFCTSAPKLVAFVGSDPKASCPLFNIPAAPLSTTGAVNNTLLAFVLYAIVDVFFISATLIPFFAV